MLQEDPALQLSSLNVHRLAITGVLLAAKLMDDNYFNNTYYAKVRQDRCCTVMRAMASNQRSYFEG